MAGGRKIEEQLISLVTQMLPAVEKAAFANMLSRLNALLAKEKAIPRLMNVEFLLCFIPPDRLIVSVDANIGSDGADYVVPAEKRVVTVIKDRLHLDVLEFWQMDDGIHFNLKGRKYLNGKSSTVCALGIENRFVLTYQEARSIKLEVWDFASQQVVATHSIKNAGDQFIDLKALPQMALVAIAKSNHIWGEKLRHLVFVDACSGTVLDNDSQTWDTNVEVNGGNIGNLAISASNQVAIVKKLPRYGAVGYGIELNTLKHPTSYQTALATMLFEQIGLDCTTITMDHVGIEFPTDLAKQLEQGDEKAEGNTEKTSNAKLLSKLGSPIHVGASAAQAPADVLATAAAQTSMYHPGI